MTLAPQHMGTRGSTTQGATVRLDLAWTVSARAIGAGSTYASAVLHVEADWAVDGDATRGAAINAAAVNARCTIIAGARATHIALPGGLCTMTHDRGHWAHVTLQAGAEVILRASFEQGRLVYCTSGIPARAGLGGAAYDTPTGTLDIYPAPSGA